MNLIIHFLVLLIVKQILIGRCYTPENQQCQCVPLHTCPQALHAIANPPRGSEAYLRKLICKDEQELKVCCDDSANFTDFAEPNLMYESIHVEDAIPGCYQKESSDVVVPVILTKNGDCDVEFEKCVGVLINSKYVLTAAQCVAPNNETQKVVGVRFRGKNNVSNEIGIEETIPHPFYDPVSGFNDLALLRLNGTVSEDDQQFVCIYRVYVYNVENDEDQFSDGGDFAAVTEPWYKKTTVSTRFLPRQSCKQILRNKNVNVAITQYNLCMEDFKKAAEVEWNEYAGVPLLYEFPERTLIGISSSRIGCSDGLPDVYTSLPAYRHWLMDNIRPWFDDNEQCTTPNGEAGQCRNIIYCPKLLETFSEARKGTVYLRKFVCENPAAESTISVCCVASANSMIFENDNGIQSVNVPAQFLENERCGLQHRDDYFSSSTAVTLDEFPWIALVQTKDDEGYYHSCTGTLINGRYVLTTAYCATMDTEETIVRLGDYNQLNETDCVKDVDVDETDCIDYEIFGVEDKISHPFYISKFGLNNIALLRLNKTVFYTDYVRPICLPVQGTAVPKAGDSLYMTSWGFREDNSNEGIKKKVLTRLISNSECQRRLKKSLLEGYISSSNMCSDDYKNNTEFADGLDEGGALMSENNYRWHIAGLVDSNVFDRGLPIKYVNVSKYVNWILDSMRSW